MVLGCSFWWILPILFLAGLVARFKYKKLTGLPDIGIRLALLIAFIRFAVVFVLLFILLQPTLLLINRVKEKPLLLVAVDNSASLLNTKDSLYYRNEYGASLKNKVEELQDQFAIEYLTFGKNVKKNGAIDLTENYTDISGLFDYIRDNYISRRPAAILLWSDGIYNAGVNPRYKQIDCPVYTIGLGDTVQLPDVYIKSIDCDKFNYIRTIFPIKVEVAAVEEKGKNIRCVLRSNGKVLDSQTLLIDNDRFLQEVVFQVEALQKGIARYTVSIETGFEERSTINNQATVYVNIIDNTGEIAIWYTAPHPDIAAISEAIEVSGIYTCTLHRFGEKWPADAKPSLLILHNPQPETPEYQQIISMVSSRKMALWYILTNRKSISDLARYDRQYSAIFNTDMNEYVNPAYNRDFPYFDFTEQEIKDFSDFPPLIVPFGEIRINSGKTLFAQQVKNNVTVNGLFSFYDRPDGRTAYLWGEGMWKWRLYSYKESGNHDLFNTLVYKTVNYLIARRNNERFIQDIKPLYDESEEIMINAELYNDSYELTNEPDIKLKLAYKDKDYQYLLNRKGDKYHINLGNLPAGEYSYNLSVNLKGENLDKKGLFYVRSQNPELNDMIANRQLLQDIALQSGGSSVDLQEAGQLIRELQGNNDFKVVYKNEIKYTDFGEMKILGILILLLLCIEWFLLKYFAG